ncbi:BZ3501_MvSof-1269-A2-R1_Chr10-1g02386 [Microbotryum saponariae]|nr:BZ3501_MvSof-1269-A2-R1_C27g00019 [Microbotryum saponariae]SDA06274.1 BZ3501_MvSof-1269-A2-R1_Chr10-1g02386 [Microbotryum saponariae]
MYIPKSAAGEIAGAPKRAKRAWDLGARSEPGPLAQPQARWLWTWGARVSYFDRIPVDCAFGPWGHGYDAGSPGSPHLAENIMDAVDWSIGRLSPPIAVNRVHAIATAPANDPPIPVHADADELDLLGVATDDVNDTPVVHRPPDPLPQPFLDTVIRAYANDSQAQVIIMR